MSLPVSTLAAPTAAPDQRKPSFRADIQGLRAFAVVVVILDHLFHWPSGGFVGVDVFFVISGFLITSHILKELERTGRLSLSGFYRRRIRRIAPAATLVIVVTVTASAFLLPRGRAVSVAIDGVWAFFFGANWRSMMVGTDYFQLGQLPSPLQHYWSLSVEEQFYFVWPLLAMIVFMGAMRRWRTTTAARVAITVVFTLLVVASFVWAVVETSSNPTAAYFSTFSRAWELGVGSLLAAITLRPWRLPFAFRVALAWLGIVGLLTSIFWIDSSSVFPAPTAALPVLSTAAVIAAGMGSSSARSYDRALWPLTNRVSTYLGGISYSLYLWHFPVIVLLASLVPVDSTRYFVFALVITAITSVLSYHLVEEPVRRSRWLLPKSKSSVSGGSRRGPAVVAASAVAVLLVCAGLGAARLATPEPTPTPPAADVACFGATAAPGAALDCDRPDPLTIDQVVPTLDDLQSDTAGGYACWRPKGGELKTCTYGSTAPNAVRVALVGDSHAAALLPAFLDQAEAHNWSVDTFVGFGCQWRTQEPGSDCDAVEQQTQQRLLDGGYDVVVTTGARWANVDASTEQFTSQWSPVIATGTKVVVVEAVPTVPEATFACISRVGVDLNGCVTDVDEATSPVDAQLAAASASGAAVVDMTDFYCDETECPAVIGSVIVYRDAAGHISGTYMKSMAPYLADRIEAAVG
ncbi:acyltransferase family protein [Agromyces allii]|uniref:Acyltransferase family protein n=1 Tax=Agromyces allii TaxID=393607 RepID=A0ABP5BF71_9MICO|nr:acyltransferase family protein [Agromyces allii]